LNEKYENSRNKTNKHDSEFKDLVLLKSARGNSQVKSTSLTPSIAVNQDSQALFEIDAFLDCQRCKGQYKYLVKWKNYPENKATWELLEGVVHLPNLILEYYENNSRKIRPSKRSITIACKRSLAIFPCKS